MPSSEDSCQEWVTCGIRIALADRTLKAEIPVPAGLMRPAMLLPIFQSLTGALAEHAMQVAERKGRSVSCKAGCAACCRKLVPLSEMEVRRLHEVFEGLPESTRSGVLARFDVAMQSLKSTGLLDRLGVPDGLNTDEFWSIGLEYFRQWISCPFLENERCVIYEDRPIACRECLVVSPPSDCFPDSKATAVGHLVLPCSVSAALAHIHDSCEYTGARWIPLILMPDWVKAHPERKPTRTGPELLNAILAIIDDRMSNP